MSEEKLYAVKNDEGKYLTIERMAPWWDSQVGTAVRNIDVALAWSKKYGGHVVTFNEEPKKAVLSEKQAKIVEGARVGHHPASGISLSGDNDEELLMNAYVNGYTVKKDKKYRVITPKSWWASENEPEYMHMNVSNGIENYKGADDDTLFTQKQLDLYELNGAPFTKEEVTDDEV